MIKALWSAVLSLWLVIGLSQSAERVESEYKLAIPTEQADRLWNYLQSESFLSPLRAEYQLTSDVSVEDFLDVYYDDELGTMYDHQVGLRYRSRYLKDSLIKQLVQLKTPLAADGVARTETKYDIKKSQDRNDFFARHPLLKLIKKNDRSNLNYVLGGFGTTAQEMKPELRLRQTRKRIYLADEITSLATITLDEVTNISFPYQRYTEMELELNEVRYTQAMADEKIKMETFNQKLRNGLVTAFPELTQDQTPKYNKMKAMIDSSIWSKIYEWRGWIILTVLSIIALVKLLIEWKDLQIA